MGVSLKLNSERVRLSFCPQTEYPQEVPSFQTSSAVGFFCGGEQMDEKELDELYSMLDCEGIVETESGSDETEELILGEE